MLHHLVSESFGYDPAVSSQLQERTLPGLTLSPQPEHKGTISQEATLETVPSGRRDRRSRLEGARQGHEERFGNELRGHSFICGDL